MDLPTLNAIIRVNGLTTQSSPENITDVLLRSGYTKEEVPEALSVLAGAPPPQSSSVAAAYVEPILQHTKRVTRIAGEASLFTGRIGVRQFWLSSLLALLTYGLAFLIVEVSTVPLFSLVSGISLFSPPDLAIAPVRTLLLFGIGVSMLVLPAIFFLVISVGLQVRRCHDYGISGVVWFTALLALVVSAYLLDRLTPLALVAVALALLIWLALLSWPGADEDNEHGSPVTYPSLWAALRGSFDEADNLNRFARRFLLPLAYLQVSGLILGFCIHTLIPRAHPPSVSSASMIAPAPDAIGA